MIRTMVRASLTAGDAELAIALLGKSEPERRRLTQKALEEGPDVLWDDPRLMPALLGHRGLSQPSASLLLYVVLRRLMLELGIDDRAVSDYCAALVLAFGYRDRAFRVSDHDENRYDYLVDLVAEAGRAEGERGFQVRVHVGNFALWLAGMFPDYIAARRVSKGGPGLPYYEALGRSGFRLASDHRLAERYGLTPVLRVAADRFGTLRVALNRLSDQMLFPHHAGPDRLLRQVADAFAQRAGELH
jgi:hypothetical protein